MRSVTWRAWSCDVTLALTDAEALADARAVVERELRAMDAAASRFRADSEISRVNADAGRLHRVSPLLAEAVATALRAARLTDGIVDPTLGRDIAALGYDRDIEDVRRRPARSGPAAPAAATYGWRDVHLDGEQLLLPRGLALDLGATAKALTADRAAAAVLSATGSPALVSVGGDVAAVGGAEWELDLSEHPQDDQEQLLTAYDGGIATSSTLARRWTVDGEERHHLLDPRTRRPADGPWRTATVAARSCVAANTASTAAIVLGVDAPVWLAACGLPARLVAQDDSVTRVAGWPDADADEDAGTDDAGHQEDAA
jgi:thiamine biosynthesis lipoprotein